MPNFHHNPELLSELIFALEMSQGEFRLFLARSNTLTQRDRLIEKLEASFSGDLATLQLDESVRELNTTIGQQLGEQQPDALMVWGLESVTDVDQLLVSMGLVREEFKNNFHFPILLWIDKEISIKFIRLIPDFESWASLTVFETPTQELIDFIQQTSDRVYQKVLENGAGIFLDDAELGLTESSYQELVGARQELANRGTTLEAELEAGLEFVLGRAADNSTETALEHYQGSLELWQQLNNPLRVAHTNYYLGLWWQSYAVRNRVEKDIACQKACSYFQNLIEGFEAINRPDLVAKFINAWGEVLQTLGRWDELESVANRAIEVLDRSQPRSRHNPPTLSPLPPFERGELAFESSSPLSEEGIRGDRQTSRQESPSSSSPLSEEGIRGERQTSTKESPSLSSPLTKGGMRGDYQTSFRLAFASHLLAEFQLAKSNYKQAKKLAQTAIEIFHKTLNAASTSASEKDQIILDWEKYSRLGRYLFSLAKAEKGLGEIKSAIGNFEQAKDTTNPQYNAQFYIDILSELREIYYEEKAYLEAFEIKQEKLKVEQQFGFQAFIGANRLRDIKLNINPALPQSKQRVDQQKITQEIAASGRQSDVETLVERISRPDYKLIVIHGQSGVGKSSILQAGLVPTLEGKSIATRDVVVVLQRVYVNWISELGKILAEKLQVIANLTVNSESLNSAEDIFAQLRNNGNDELNLLTVIIFDQFEEFFFANSEPKDKREFAQFLQECLKIPFVKVVLSLRSDYIHYLLEFNRLGNLEAINNNILDKSILYYLGNFSQSQAKLVIEGLTANSQFKIDENLTEKLVEDLAQELGEIRPIELQVVGAQLQSDNITTLEKYLELGENPKAELVEEYLASVVRDCGEENEKLAWLMLLLFTDENNTRPLKTKAELLKESKFSAEELELVLNIFVDSGLVFLLPENPADHYQLVHDYLVGFIRQKKDVEILEELNQEREKRREAEEQGRQLEELLRQKEEQRRQLEEALKKVEQEQEKRELAEEKQGQEQKKRELAEEKRQQLQKWLVRSSVAAATLVLTGGMTIFGLQANNQSQRTKVIAVANESITLSISGQPLDGLIKAMEARQKQINSKFQAAGELSNVTNALRIAVYSNTEKFKEFNRIQRHENFVIQRHENSVNSVAFSPDGQTIATASADKTVKLWSRQGELLQILTGHENSVNSVAFSPDGETIATASGDNTVKLWSRQGELLQTLKGHENSVNGVAFSPDGETIATASSDNTVKLWNRQGKLLRTLKDHKNWVNGVVFSPDGKTIATASGDNTVKLWNRQGKLLRTLTGHDNDVFAVAFSPDGKTIATASGDKTVKLWNLQGKELQTLAGHNDRVFDVAFSYDGETIATASWDNTVKLWNRQGEFLQTLTGHNSDVFGVAFSPDGETIATASWDNTVKLWNRQGELLQTLKGHNSWVYGVAFSPDGETIATASRDKTVKLWSRQGELLQTLKEHEGWVISVAFSRDGKTIATASEDKTAKLWNSQGELLQTLKGHENLVMGVAFSPDGETIATASRDNTVKLWNLEGKLLQTLKGHENSVNGVAFSPDGKMIATASHDNTVKLWNRQGQLLHTLEGHEDWVNGVVFSPDGEIIVSASSDNTVKLWNRQGQLLQTLTGHENSVWGVAFSPDKKTMTIATASADKTVKLWKDWQIEDLTKLGCEWLNDYLISHPQELKELEICQTYGRKKVASRGWIIEGEKLARESKGEAEKLEAAVAAFKTALKWNPDLDLNPNFKALAASLGEAEKLMEEGTKLAREGEIEAAVEKYQQAKELDEVALIPTLQNIDPEAKAKYEVAEAAKEILYQGSELARKGKVKGAIASYQAAEKIDPNQISARYWAYLCRQGSLNKQAADVMFACEKAVALDPENGGIIDSRGLARALTGDIAGAIADFQVYVEWTDNEEEKAQRQEWIKALQAGENPFTEEVLEELRN